MLSGVMLRRIALSVPTIGGIAVVIFLLLLVMPGNPADLIQGEMVNPEVTRALVKRWGLDAPPLTRFWLWLSSLLRGDLGTSLVTGRPVLEMLGPRLAYTAYLGALGIAAGIAIGIPAGVISAVRPNTLSDYTATTVALAGLSLPVFVTALVLQLIFGFHLRLLPISGAPNSLLSPQMLTYAILPAISVGVYQAAINGRLVRTTMLDTLHQDYVRTARAKGLSSSRVVYRHALPNVLIPVVTLMGVYLRTVIAGLLLVEIIFAWPGIGRLFYDAVRQRDYPVIQGVALVTAIAIYVVNLIVDLVYAYLDPRIRVEAEA
jgi:ABC-type dipeptide/oligopeptide/nickel transport system permease component